MLTTAQTILLVHAIFIAEGGNRTHHPYGILAHYEHTSPRQACINTVQHFVISHPALSLNKVFVEQLADVYCPVASDKIGNINWKHNVERICKL